MSTEAVRAFAGATARVSTRDQIIFAPVLGVMLRPISAPYAS